MAGDGARVGTELGYSGSAPDTSAAWTPARDGGRLPAGRGSASAAANSGMNAITRSALSMPMRSASIPTNGTLIPAVPQPNPIMSDDTVAALIGARLCPKVTLTGSVDCSSNPPSDTMITNAVPSKDGATARNGTADTSDPMIMRRAPHVSASDPPTKPPRLVAKRYTATATPADPTDAPRRVSMTVMNVAKLNDASVRRTTIA